MSDEPVADFSLIARQQRQMLMEMGTMRDDRTMMTILQRLDSTVTGLVNEVRPSCPA